MATISFTTKFNLSTSPKKFVFTDTSDWAGQGISVGNVNGSFKITSPSGIVIYNNTSYSDVGCDILTDTSLINQTTISLPLGSTGLPELGTYTIVYTVYDINAVAYYTVTNTYTNSYARPVVAITQTVDCLSPLFTSTDATNYVVGAITPTIVRTNTIDYPYGTAGEGNPTIGSTAVVTSSLFYPGTQTTEISSTLTYTFTDGLIVYDIVTGVKEVVVDCTDTCGIYCCVRTLEQRMITQSTMGNPTEYAKTTSLFSQIMGLVGIVMMAVRCGKSADVAGYITSLKQLANCTDDCNSCGDSTAPVVGIGGLVNQVVVEGSTPVVVTPVTVGNTITYTVSLSAAFVTNASKTWTQVFSNSAARSAAVPLFNGQLGVQLDTDAVYQSLSVTTGDWGQVNYFKTGAGTSSMMTKSATSAIGLSSQAIGVSATSTGDYSVSIGTSVSSTGDDSQAFGRNASSTGDGSTSIGSNATSTGDYSISIGGTSASSGDDSISIGTNSAAIGTNSAAIGNSATSSGDDSIACGSSAQTVGNDSISIGNGSATIGASSVAIGIGSTSTGASSIAIGDATNSVGTKSVSIGSDANAANDGSVAIGISTDSTGDDAVSLGNLAQATALHATAIGRVATASGATATAVGSNSTASGSVSVAVGTSSTASGVGSVALGSSGTASATAATALGNTSTAAGASSTALGDEAKSNIVQSVQISGTIITRKDESQSDYQKFFSAAVVTISTKEVDLKTTGDYTITIPTGSMFYPDSVDLVITNANTVTGQPTVRAGGDVSTASLLAATGTTGMTTTFHRQRFNTLLVATGQATLTAGVTVAATGTTLKGRFVFSGKLIENE